MWRGLAGKAKVAAHQPQQSLAQPLQVDTQILAAESHLVWKNIQRDWKAVTVIMGKWGVIWTLESHACVVVSHAYMTDY